MNAINQEAVHSEEIRALDAQHHLHPFTDTQALNSKGARIIERAEGVYLWDSEGNKIIDGMAGLWCVNIGYGRKELAEAAQRQMNELLLDFVGLAFILLEIFPPQWTDMLEKFLDRIGCIPAVLHGHSNLRLHGLEHDIAIPLELHGCILERQCVVLMGSSTTSRFD